jgi:hypothetical protein
MGLIFHSIVRKTTSLAERHEREVVGRADTIGR